MERGNDSFVSRHKGQQMGEISIPLQQVIQQLQGASGCARNTDITHFLTPMVASGSNPEEGRLLEVLRETVDSEAFRSLQIQYLILESILHQ